MLTLKSYLYIKSHEELPFWETPTHLKKGKSREPILPFERILVYLNDIGNTIGL